MEALTKMIAFKCAPFGIPEWFNINISKEKQNGFLKKKNGMEEKDRT